MAPDPLQGNGSRPSAAWTMVAAAAVAMVLVGWGLTLALLIVVLWQR